MTTQIVNCYKNISLRVYGVMSIKYYKNNKIEALQLTCSPVLNADS